MKKFIVFILVVCSIGGMYYFSSQDAQVSGSQSQSVVKIIDKIRQKLIFFRYSIPVIISLIHYLFI